MKQQVKHSQIIFLQVFHKIEHMTDFFFIFLKLPSLFCLVWVWDKIMLTLTFLCFVNK